MKTNKQKADPDPGATLAIANVHVTVMKSFDNVSTLFTCGSLMKYTIISHDNDDVIISR